MSTNTPAMRRLYAAGSLLPKGVRKYARTIGVTAGAWGAIGIQKLEEALIWIRLTL